MDTSSPQPATEVHLPTCAIAQEGSVPTTKAERSLSRAPSPETVEDGEESDEEGDEDCIEGLEDLPAEESQLADVPFSLLGSMNPLAPAEDESLEAESPAPEAERPAEPMVPSL